MVNRIGKTGALFLWVRAPIHPFSQTFTHSILPKRTGLRLPNSLLRRPNGLTSRVTYRLCLLSGPRSPRQRALRTCQHSHPDASPGDLGYDDFQYPTGFVGLCVPRGGECDLLPDGDGVGYFVYYSDFLASV